MEQEEVLFEVREEITPAVQREFYWRTTPLLVKLVMAAIIGGGFYMLYQMWAYPWRRNIFLLLMAVYLIVWPVVRIPLGAASRIRQLKKLYGGQIPEATITFGEKIRAIQGESVHVFTYDQVEKTMAGKHVYILWFRGKAGIMVIPTGFTKGNMADWKIFLAEKCPGGKIR